MHVESTDPFNVFEKLRKHAKFDFDQEPRDVNVSGFIAVPLLLLLSGSNWHKQGKVEQKEWLDRETPGWELCLDCHDHTFEEMPHVSLKHRWYIRFANTAGANLYKLTFVKKEDSWRQFLEN
jgi:hypothetical protein